MTSLYHTTSIMKTVRPDTNEKMEKGTVVKWRQNDT